MESLKLRMNSELTLVLIHWPASYLSLAVQYPLKRSLPQFSLTKNARTGICFKA